jgi:signal transduction histidine kinase
MIGPLNEDQKLMLGIAERNIDRLTTLTSELLDLTKIEAGQLDILPAEVDLGTLAAEVVEADRPLAEHEGVDLVLAAPEEPVMATCDRDRIYQVIQNMVRGERDRREGPRLHQGHWPRHTRRRH